MTKARRWVLVPGKWVGCVPLAPGQPAWGMTARDAGTEEKHS